SAVLADGGGGSRSGSPDGPLAAAAPLRPPPKQLARNSVVSIPPLPSGLAFEDLPGGGNNCETAFLRGFKIFAPAALEQPPFLVRKKARRPQYRPVVTGIARARDWALEIPPSCRSPPKPGAARHQPVAMAEPRRAPRIVAGKPLRPVGASPHFRLASCQTPRRWRGCRETGWRSVGISYAEDGQSGG